VARAPEDGFTLIELVVATGVMLAAVVAMLSTTLAGFQGIAVARRRQSANALANQAIEEIRALPFDTVTHGLGNTDLSATTDTRITKSGSGSTGVYTFGGEQIPHADNPTTTPVVPHQSTVVRNNLTYTVSAYLTFYQNVATSNTYRATVIVSWPSLTGSQSTSQVQVQTVLFSPIAGAKTCPSSKTHPFPAPCQPFLYGSASRSAGVISLSGTVSGIGLDHAALWLPSQSSSMQVEQTFAVQGSSQTSGATLQLTGQSEQSGGRQQVTSGADNDPAQSKPGYQTDSVGSQASGELDASGNNNQLSVLWGANDVAGTASTINASTSTDSSSPPKFGPCPLLVPSSSFDLSQNDNQPCGSSKGQQGGTLSTALSVKAGPNSLNTTLLSATASPVPSTAFTNRDATAEATVCKLVPSGSDGCLESQQSRALGTITLLQLPIGTGLLLPVTDLPGYDVTKGLVQLTGFSDSVSAEAGVGAGAPVATVAGGTVTYFNGGGYSTIPVTSTPTAIPLGLGGSGIHVTDSIILGALLNVDITANLSTGATSTSDPAAGCTNPCTRAIASAQSTSPIQGSFEYKLTYAGTVYADVTATVDLGTLLAKSSYTAAPVG
jgi:type II secretory pathway pseudopilin PulG